MNPLISVIVPVHNGQNYIEKCIDSIIGQTYPALEIIIVNDGSTDGTADVCKKLSNKHTDSVENHTRLVTVVTQEKSGVSAARNNGITKACGEYISFVDADDRLKPDMLQKLYDDMISTGSDVSGCKFTQWESEEQWDEVCRSKSELESIDKEILCVFNSSEYAEQIIEGNSRCWSKLYKRSMIIESGVRFSEAITIGEDMLFLAELTRLDIKFCESSYQGYGYYLNDTGAMNKKFTKQSMDQIYCWERAREILGKSAKIDSIILISVLLTIGRIAVIDNKERSGLESEIKIAYETLRKYYSRESVRLLDKGYRIKVAIFRFSPKLYMNMYSLWKR